MLLIPFHNHTQNMHISNLIDLLSTNRWLSFYRHTVLNIHYLYAAAKSMYKRRDAAAERMCRR